MYKKKEKIHAVYTSRGKKRTFCVHSKAASHGVASKINDLPFLSLFYHRPVLQSFCDKINAQNNWNVKPEQLITWNNLPAGTDKDAPLPAATVLKVYF